MPVSKFKTWTSGEVLTASDLNSSFDQVFNNGEDLGWPATKAKDLDGFELTLDSDGDSGIVADTDDRTDIKLSGVDLFRFDGTTTSPVNGLDFIAAATGSDPYVVPQGSDSNINMVLVPKGTGVHILKDPNGNEILKSSYVASAVNEVTLKNAATGNAAEVQATGGDTDIDLKLTPKGAGNVVVSTDLEITGNDIVDSSGNELISVSSTASAVNEITVVNAATGNGPDIQATGDDTDIDLNLTPKGAGALVVGTGAINENKGADIASATTTDIGAGTGNIIDITGTTTITGLGTVKAGTRRVIQFDGALILTHNASSLILPGGGNITTSAGDVGEFYSLGSGNWLCTNWQYANGQAIAPAANSVQYLGTFTASNAATLDITGVFSSTYTKYQIAVHNVVPATDNTYLWMRASVSSTFQSAASDYGWIVNSGRDNGSDTNTAGNRADTSAAQIVLNDTTPAGLGTGTNEKAFATVNIWDPATGNVVEFDWRFIMRSSDAGNMHLSDGMGQYKGSTSAVDGIQFLMSSGNITATARVYGYP